MSISCLTEEQLFEAVGAIKATKSKRPITRTDLKNYVSSFLNINISDQKLCPGHDSPMDYLWHSYNSDFDSSANGDCVVWAGRGGGKTFIASIAALLDCVFKPGCKTRILAGSEEQAHLMYDNLASLAQDHFPYLLFEKQKNKCRFVNGSDVQVLTQSMASVRGSHIHKIRCDEVELFERPIFEAAKFITKSSGGIVGAMETLSTMHHPFGIMHELVEKAKDNGTKIFKWCIWEVIENCRDRSCGQCPLNNDCRGRAKKANGFYKIDDVIAQLKRTSRAMFDSEILCLRPSLQNVVFAEFDPNLHIKSVEYNSELPLYRSIDFGFVNPFVCLWIQVDSKGVVRVIDEYVQSRRTIDYHADVLKNRKPYNEEKVIMTFCDPAGSGVNDVTGTSPVSMLRAKGIRLRYKRSLVLEGVELVRKALRTGDGKSSLVISSRCGNLIQAMQSYHYPQSGSIETPQKDGVYDHPIDALRYFFVNHNSLSPAKTRNY
ncbi:MAG: Terminase-like family protein [Planctomycetes bacterium ADurb.Bin401]|nr:MAG: Terminase-like family protein [Planctomycetes bacterium ADurb.Bin401]